MSDTTDTLKEEILGLVQDYALRHCQGCELNRFSQRQHTCLMLTRAEKVDWYFDRVWREIISDEEKAKLVETFVEREVMKYCKGDDACDQWA